MIGTTKNAVVEGTQPNTSYYRIVDEDGKVHFLTGIEMHSAPRDPGSEIEIVYQRNMWGGASWQARAKA